MAKKARASRYATAAQVRALQTHLKQTTGLIVAMTEHLESLQREVTANVRRIGEIQHEMDVLRVRVTRP
jgi:chromosome segregation ATPase